MLGALLDSSICLDYLPKCFWDPEGEDYSALYLHSDLFHIENWLMFDPSYSVTAVSDDPEMKVSGEQFVLLVPEAEDLDEVPLQEAVSLL